MKLEKRNGLKEKRRASGEDEAEIPGSRALAWRRKRDLIDMSSASRPMESTPHTPNFGVLGESR